MNKIDTFIIILKWQIILIVATLIISFFLAFDYLYRWFPKEVIITMIQIYGLLNIFFSKRIKKEIKNERQKNNG